MNIKEFLKPLIKGTRFEPAAKALFGEAFASNKYWDKRYRRGESSGAGSYGRLAIFKADILNNFVKRNAIDSVMEFGSGDGNQLKLAQYQKYTGYDVSEAAVQSCRLQFRQDNSKSFFTLNEYDGRKGDLVLSLDVIYHLIEDEVYENYMTTIFESSNQFVIIYSSNKDENPKDQHVRHRKFTDWILVNRSDFSLVEHIPQKYPYDPMDDANTSFADFYVYETASK